MATFLAEAALWRITPLMACSHMPKFGGNCAAMLWKLPESEGLSSTGQPICRDFRPFLNGRRLQFNPQILAAREIGPQIGVLCSVYNSSLSLYGSRASKISNKAQPTLKPVENLTRAPNSDRPNFPAVLLQPALIEALFLAPSLRTSFCALLISSIFLSCAGPAAAAPAAGHLQVSVVESRATSKRAAYDPVSERERADSDAFGRRVARAVDQLERGQAAQAEGNYDEALKLYSQVVAESGDFAFSAYARIGRAIALYEVGDRTEAILEMEDMSVELKGFPEIHAALASALYADKHALQAAEQQFTIATMLDKRFTNAEWVAETKHWPPSLIRSLQKFLSLA